MSLCVFSYRLSNAGVLLYRSQDKGFHVEKGLLHVFTRSLPFLAAQTLQVEEAVERHRVEYNITAELSDYIFRYIDAETLMLYQ